MSQGTAGGSQPAPNAAGKEGETLPVGDLAGDQTPPGQRGNMNPGDEVPPDAPGAGENTCRACGGSGRQGNESCKNCGGTGKVYEAVSGGP